MAVSNFTTIRTADLIDHLCAAVDTAREATSVSPSWLRAIDSAYDYLLTTDAISYDLDHHAIRVESATTPGTFYTANGDCPCPAFTKGKGVCWHRAAARIVRRALDMQEQATQIAAAEPAEQDAEAEQAGHPGEFVTIATLSDGTEVAGSFDTDGSHCCVHVETEQGGFITDETGHVVGDWAGVHLELSPVQVSALGALFRSNLIPTLQEIGRIWCHATTPEPVIVPDHLYIWATITQAIEHNREQLGLTVADTNKLAFITGQAIQRAMGVVTWEETPNLTATA